MRDLGSVRLLYIAETQHSLEFQLLAKSLGTEAVGIRDLCAEDLRSDPHVVVDVDLRSSSNLNKLKQLLAYKGTGCRVFLLDARVWSLTSSAMALKANKILEPRCEPQEIRKAIREFLSLADSPAVTHSVDAGVAVVKESFRALVCDEVFDTTGVQTACGQVVDAIDSAGIDDWLQTVRGYHFGTFQHCLLVTGTASNFARRLGMRRDDVIRITAAAMVHDIGKAAIPVEILDKNGPLAPHEQRRMRKHPAIGHRFLSRKSKFAADALRSVRSHHEYLDGSGYPDGIGGSEIDDITRIITISDIYAALVEQRAYKPAKSATEALQILSALTDAGKLERALVREFSNVYARSA